MDELKLEIKRLIVSALELEDLAPESIGDATPLFGEGLGLDSIDALELGVALRRKYGLRIEADDAEVKSHFRSVESLARLVLKHRGANPSGSTA